MQRLDLDRSLLDTRLILIILFLSALVVRAVFALFVLEFDRPQSGAEFDYHWRAKVVSEGSFFDTANRAPFVAVFLAPFYYLFGPELEVGRIVMILVSACGAPLLFLLGRTIASSPTIGILAATYWVFYPPGIWYSVWVQTETWSAVLVTITLLLHYRATHSNYYLVTLFLGCCWGLLILNRSVFLFYPLLFLLLAIWCQICNCKARSLSLKQCLVAFLGFAAVMSPWVIHNYEVHNAFIPHSTQGGTLLLMTNNNLDHPRVRIGGYEKDAELFSSTELTGVTEVGIERVRRQLAFQALKSHLEERKLKLFKVILHRAANFWSWQPDPYDPGWTRNDSIMLFFWLPILVFSIFSPALKSWREHLPLILTILYCFAFVLPFWGTPRFRFPIDPAVVLIGIWGIVNTFSRFRVK